MACNCCTSGILFKARPVTNVSFEQLFLNKVKHIQEKQKKNRMKLDLQAKTENPNILLYAQPHPQGILPF